MKVVGPVKNPAARVAIQTSKTGRVLLRHGALFAKIATGATLVGGAMSYAEIVDRTLLTTPAENSKLVGQERKSWNPITRFTSWLGLKIGDALFAKEDKYYRTRPGKRP